MKKLEREISRATDIQPAEPRQETPTDFFSEAKTSHLFSVLWRTDGEWWIRTPDTAFDRITV
jgi:hypothetical protein